jgi:hypothetical protein
MRNHGIDVPSDRGQLTVRIRRICAFVFLAAIVPAAYACKCAQVSLETRVHDGDSIFTAEVIGTSPGTVTGYGFEGPGTWIYIRVLRSFKGQYRPGDKDVYATFKTGGSCGVPVVVGQQLLVYGYRGSWFLGMCNSSSGDQMTADVEKIEKFIAKRARS